MWTWIRNNNTDRNMIRSAGYMMGNGRNHWATMAVKTLFSVIYKLFKVILIND